MSWSEIGLIVYIITAMMYLHILIQLRNWRDGLGLRTLKTLVGALFLFNVLTACISGSLIVGESIHQIAPFILIVQLILFAAAGYIIYIIDYYQEK